MYMFIFREKISMVKRDFWRWNLSTARTLVNTYAKALTMMPVTKTWQPNSTSWSTVSVLQAHINAQHWRSNPASMKIRRCLICMVSSSQWLNPWIIEASIGWGSTKSCQPNDINLNFSQFICDFIVVQTTLLNLILSSTLSIDGRDKT